MAKTHAEQPYFWINYRRPLEGESFFIEEQSQSENLEQDWPAKQEIMLNGESLFSE